ncbi:MAG: holo-ACP synthase [Thermodesulfobacteria bacterium]|nr:holo-ACP synthase [Thermodesulfobacteriota bacterium]
MILGVGIDLVEVPRVEQILKKYPQRFLERVFTSGERAWLSECGLSPLRVAALFAGKEACSKALGTGLRGISWQEMEILHEPSGKPILKLHGRALSRFQTLGGRKLHLSLSHERQYATAIVILEGEPP